MVPLQMPFFLYMKQKMHLWKGSLSKHWLSNLKTDDQEYTFIFILPSGFTREK